MMCLLLQTTRKTKPPGRKLCFHHLDLWAPVPNSADFHFEGDGHGPVVITGIGKEHKTYSSASPILFVEHCITLRTDRRFRLLFGVTND
uniref:Uncharacterized protein n=1 Tax=Lepeophtheirus salmonis TaxID=72036 RepID=A0A0K2UAC7_LEPSM